jgi:hypothetical protein
LSDIKGKFKEIKRIGIIKDFKEIIKPNGEKDYNIEFFDYLPPEKALIKLDFYLFEKYGLIIDEG